MGLNVVALVSGGKDSFFSILHCQANGHKIVALANLHPPDGANGPVDDMDSYMYQTIGHTIIPLYEQALGLPLYRQAIEGGAANSAKSYGVDTLVPNIIADETESLVPLLQKVISAHPEVNAVSTGAILSDYQRTRVESVAIRLGLTPLSYLWQWPNLPPHTQATLLQDMAAIGQDSRIVKVASGGLDESFLWRNVADYGTVSRLSKAVERFGSIGDGAVLGEGGEYETLAIGGPVPLWKRHIQVAPDDIEFVTGEAGSASLRIKHASIVDPSTSSFSIQEVRVPPVLEERFRAMLDQVQSIEGPGKLSRGIVSSHECGSKALIGLYDVTGRGSNIAEQTTSVMEQIMQKLAINQHTITDVVYTVIILRHMADFPAFNAVYGSYFTRPSPPARVTIACAEVLPPHAMLSICLLSSYGGREGLHVQSRSYWAPANIGPYSQAIELITHEDLGAANHSVYIAGQIPLVPANMELPRPRSSRCETFAEQTVLALQHLERVGRTMKVKSWKYAFAFITGQAEDALPLLRKAEIVRKAWAAWHAPSIRATYSEDDDENFDVWNTTYGAGSTPWRAQASESDFVSMGPEQVPPLVVICADSVPRGADVEWVGYGKAVTERDGPMCPHFLRLFDTLLQSSRVVFE